MFEYICTFPTVKERKEKRNPKLYPHSIHIFDLW